MSTNDNLKINLAINKVVQDMSDFVDEQLVCGRCGGEAYRKGEDFIDYCDNCGIVEGLCKPAQDVKVVPVFLYCEVCGKPNEDAEYARYFFCSAECDLEADKQYDNYADSQNG